MNRKHIFNKSSLVLGALVLMLSSTAFADRHMDEWETPLRISA